MKRKNIPPKVLAEEGHAITQFLFDWAVPAPGLKLPIRAFFLAYAAWRKSKKMTPTVLSIDGFGRLFPHSYKRGPAYWPLAGHTLKCVFGWTLK